MLLNSIQVKIKQNTKVDQSTKMYKVALITANVEKYGTALNIDQNTVKYESRPKYKISKIDQIHANVEKYVTVLKIDQNTSK